MAKRQKGKIIPMLSPEKYIRQKARSLEIFDCWVNTDWNKTNMATVIVARKHTNDNVTVGFYLVDLNCLGIKDSYFMFNITIYEYTELLQKVSAGLEMEKTNYTLAHNIVFAGVEFADEYGFKPAKDFTLTTRYILEEDDENIELIEIECGMNGMPAYMRGPDDTDVMVKKVIAKLKNTAGEGNYHYFDKTEVPGDEENDMWDDTELIDDYDDLSINKISEYAVGKMDELENKFDILTTREKAMLYHKLDNKEDKLTVDERFEYIYLGVALTNEMIDKDKVTRISHHYAQQMKGYIITEEFTPGFLGIKPELSEEHLVLAKLFGKFHDASKNDLDAAEKHYQKMLNKFSHSPAVAFADLLLTSMKNDESLFLKKIKIHYQRFPDYPIIHIMHDLTNPDKLNLKELLNEGFDRYFLGRNEIQDIEMFQYFNMLAIICLKDNDLTSLESICNIVHEFYFDTDLSDKLYRTIELFKRELIKSLSDQFDNTF
jgi:hypothetical protein